jgi:hypothetical protein
MWTDSPVIEIRVNSPAVDVIHVSAEKTAGWKLDGWKGDTHGAPDQLQDNFDCIVNVLAKYVDESSVWTNLKTGRKISAWEAMTILTKYDDEDSFDAEEGQ